MRMPFPMLVLAGLLAAPAAQAGSLRFTIEAPGIQTFQGTEPSIVQNFDSYTFNAAFPPSGTTDTSVGRYVGGVPSGGGSRTTAPADVFGGAGGSGNYLESINAGYTLDFLAAGPKTSVGYFGFWWSAGDGENQLTINMADGSSRVFVTQAILDSPSLQGSPGVDTDTPNGHFGNPNGPFGSSYNTGEPYAFVNIYAQDAGSKITSIVFSELGPSGFETDNHTVVVGLIDGTNQGGSEIEIPLPATTLLVGAGIGLLGWTRRRRRG
jgi:hypothetical protein